MESADHIALRVHQLSARMARECDQILQERLGIGLSQYKILAAVERNEGLQQRAVALELGQTEASVSRQVRLLAASGLLTVRRNPANRREHRSELTARGVRVTAAAAQALGNYHHSLASRLSPRQQEVLQSLLDQLENQ